MISPVVVKNCEKDLHTAFPSLDEEFFKLLLTRVKAHGFTSEQLVSAVQKVIDNCHYPRPSIADFIAGIEAEDDPFSPENIAFIERGGM